MLVFLDNGALVLLEEERQVFECEQASLVDMQSDLLFDVLLFLEAVDDAQDRTVGIG